MVHQTPPTVNKAKLMILFRPKKDVKPRKKKRTNFVLLCSVSLQPLHSFLVKELITDETEENCTGDAVAAGNACSNMLSSIVLIAILLCCSQKHVDAGQTCPRRMHGCGAR